MGLTVPISVPMVWQILDEGHQVPPVSSAQTQWLSHAVHQLQLSNLHCHHSSHITWVLEQSHSAHQDGFSPSRHIQLLHPATLPELKEEIQVWSSDDCG